MCFQKPVYPKQKSNTGVSQLINFPLHFTNIADASAATRELPFWTMDRTNRSPSTA